MIKAQQKRKNTPKRNILLNAMSNLNLMNILISQNMIQRELQVRILKLIYLNRL